MSIEFRARSVRHSRGPNPGALLVVGLVAFIGLAVLKPWASGPSDPRPRPSATPSSAATSEGPTAAPAPPAAVGWAAVDRLWGVALQVLDELPVRSEVGVRVITEPQPGQPDGPQPDGSIVTSIARGALVERWYRAELLAADASWWTSSTWLTGVTADRPALAIGVTTGATDVPLDYRFYRYSASGSAPIALAAEELGFGFGAPDRLFINPFEGEPSPAWPSGRYVAQVLLGAGILSIGFTLPAGPRPIPVVREPVAFTPTAESVRDALRGQPAGVFVIGGSGEAMVAAAQPGPELDPREAWLALAAPVGDEGPRVAQLPQQSAAILGVVLPPGSVLQAASLWAASPGPRLLAANPIAGVDVESGPVIAFAAPGGGAWPAGTYRITARYTDSGDRLREWSWHLNLGVGPSPGSPLWLAAGRWVNLERRWSVLSVPVAPDLTRGVVETAESVTEPRTSPIVPDAIQETCPGSAHVDRVTPVIGLRFPDDVNLISARLLRRFADGRSLVVPTQQSVILPDGLVLFAPHRSWPRYWFDGYYDVEVLIVSDSAADPAPERGPLYVPLCIGDLAERTSAFTIRPNSASSAAYDAALAMPGVTMLAP